jgi:hypothetical protein
MTSSWIGFGLFWLVTIGLGVWAARARPERAFWHGFALASTSSAMTGLAFVVLIFNAPLEEQPSVLPPWPVFALGLLVIAGMAGAIGGAAGLAFANRFWRHEDGT